MPGNEGSSVHAVVLCHPQAVAPLDVEADLVLVNNKEEDQRME